MTKRPENIVFSTTLENAWFGVTVTSSKEKNRIQTLREHIHGGHYHVTFEPMFDEVGMVDLTGIEWIVIGTETGHRKGKAVSKPEWVWNLTHQAHALGIPVFMKEDLLPIMGEAQMVQEFPPAFLPGIGGAEDMVEVKESSILIQNVETKNIMTKSAPAGGRLFRQSLCGLYPWLQILLRLVYEAIYRAHRTVGDIPGCETLARNQKSAKIQRAARSHRFSD